MPPIVALILEQAWTRGGPAVLQIIALAQAHGEASDVAELNRQIAVDEVAKAALDREIARVTALLGPAK